VIALDASSVCVRQCWQIFLGASSLTSDNNKRFQLLFWPVNATSAQGEVTCHMW